MFWSLLLAHFIADYPLQPNWIVRNKTRLWALLLHVSIHLVVMLAIVGAARAQVWPYLLALAVIHFWIDVGKNTIYRLRPKWVVGPYLVDQACHYLSIGLVSAWILGHIPAPALPFSPMAAILVTGFLLVTYVWSITERILAHSQPDYRLELARQFWPRMFARAALLSGLLLLWRLAPSTTAATLTTGRLPYLSGPYRRRALLTDLSVVIVVQLFIQWVS